MSDIQSLFHTFERSDQKKNWAGWTSPRMHFYNNDSILPDVPFGEEFLIALRPETMDIPHIHDGAINLFLFVPADLTRMFDDEFEVDICLGDTANHMEIYHITKPSVVAVPPGVFHCPIYYKKLPSGVNTLLHYKGTTVGRVYPRTKPDGEEEWIYTKSLVLPQCKRDPSKKCSICGLCYTRADETPEDVARYMQPFYDRASNEGKYKDCIYEIQPDYHKLGDAVMNPRLAFKGRANMPNTDEQLSFNIVTKPCVLGDEKPFTNGQIGEFLWFSGADAVDPWASFDAEIEVSIGDDPDNMQIITVTEPGVIAVPPGTWRGAINVKRADKPLCFIPFYPRDEARYKITQEVIDGKKRLVYSDEKTITDPTPGDELYLQIKR